MTYASIGLPVDEKMNLLSHDKAIVVTLKKASSSPFAGANTGSNECLSLYLEFVSYSESTTNPRVLTAY